ncbi:ubiquitin-associated protein 1-like isoform X2 [Patiria miniata]|uniref:UBA domain-containing protein n=1 Tax=Patiria miniata TaxID=46514 RepID=A0A914BS06_PATMI|nr:ubiquitin-associated protein 1-like isoform X2 [Patiria miniata]
MAYHSQSLGRSLSVTSLEGIQVRLGERFRPPEKVTLPPGYKEPNPSATLNATQYSFETERTFLQFLDAKRASDAAKEAIKQQAREEQRAAATSPVQLPNGILQPTAAKTSKSEPKNHSIPPMASLGGDIMKPVPLATANTPSSTSRLPAGAPHRNQNFDFADFENNASDPFESTELETIDDLEELKSVLAFTHVPAQPGSVTSEQPLRSPDHSLDMEVDSCPPEVTETATVSIQASEKLVSYKPDKPKPPSKPQTLSTGMNGPNSQLPKGQANLNPLPQSPEGNPDPFVRNPLPPINSTINDNGLAFSPGDGGPSRLIARGPTTDHSVQPLRNRSPPPSYDSQDFTSASNPMISPMDLPPSYPQNLSRYTPLPPSPHQSRTNSVDHGQASPDPVFDGMNSEDRNFVLTIASMGFPRSRTARAVRELGHDDRLVVEWLCAVDHLCSMGFQEDKVEFALNLQNNDLKKAEEFLLLSQRFEELGFKSEDIKRELIVHGNNEDKVLNVLTAKS